MHGNDPSHVRLKMDMMAKNLLLEEYPLAEKGLTADGDDWIREGDVNGMNGVGWKRRILTKTRISPRLLSIGISTNLPRRI